MKWPLSPEEISVVGFSGAPVPGGAGLKPPVFRHEPTGRLFTLAHDPPQFYDVQEVGDYVQRGLLSLVEKSWAPLDDGVFLYAHQKFMEPGADRLSLVHSRPVWDEKLGAWLIYEDRARALGQLARWGHALIDDAKRRLRAAAKLPIESAGADVERALDDARRARFCAPPPESRDLREDAFACWAAAWLLQGRPVDALLRDARRDFPDNQTIDRIEKAARDLARPENPIYPPRMASKNLSWERRAT